MAKEPTIADEHIITDLNTLKIIADPTRRDIMRHLDKPQTVKEVAEMLDKDPTKLYYHVRQLEKHGLIQVIETNIVSGIIEKTYQVVARQFHLKKGLIATTEMTEENIETLFGTIFDVTKDEISRSIRAGLMKPGDETTPQKDGTVKIILSLTESQAIELHSQLKSLWNEYEALSKANTDNPDAQPKGLLIAFYPILDSEQ